MQRSSERILTTHVGSLPRPADVLEAVNAKEQGEPVDEAAHAARLRGAVSEIVRKQIELGIDVIDDGEFGKPSFVSYVNERLGGFEPDTEVRRGSPWADSREARSFPEFYAEGLASARHSRMVCTGPVSYRGREQLQRDIDNLKAALDGATTVGSLHAGDLADQRGGLAAQCLLRDRRGISVRDRRGAARGIRGDRAGGFPAPGRRSASRDLLGQAARASRSRNAAPGPSCGSRRSTTRCATLLPTASATTPATASTWGRASTTWS